MSKNVKLLVGLTTVALLIVLYLIISSRTLTLEDTGGNLPGSQTNRPEEKALAVDLAALEREYKQETKIIINEFEAVAGINYPDPDNSQLAAGPDAPVVTSSSTLALRVAELRDQLMAITVPGQFKELHLDLVFAFNKMEGYFLNQALSDQASSLELLSRAKAENDWLN